MSKDINQFFVQQILQYYKCNKRELPWRYTTDPYKIWISEIILQQTQVKQGLAYYNKFIQKFPGIDYLARAKEDEILHVWQGLGYYSRARYLHDAAQQIMNEFNGEFPHKYQDILKLKGIGEYTAAAIASIAYNLPYAVLDGNVYRVLSRYFGIEIPINTAQGKKYFQRFAQDLLDKQNPSEYNQAIMEFGATYCKPINPDCSNCLLNMHCVAFHQNKVGELPIKLKTIIKKNRYFNYLVFIENGRYTYVQKRDRGDIWRGLYQFYLIESQSKFLSLKRIQDLLRRESIDFNSVVISGNCKHILTHQNLFIQFITVQINKPPLKLGMKRVITKQLFQYPFPVVIQNFIKKEYYGNNLKI